MSSQYKDNRSAEKVVDHCDHGHCHHHDHHHDHHHHDHNHGEGEKESLLHRFLPELVSLVMMLLALVFFHGHGEEKMWIKLAAYIVAVLPVAIPILKSTFGEWRRGDIFNEFTLMVMASIGAFCIGEYPEAVAVLLFYSIGEKLEDVVSGDVTSQIHRLLGKMPKSASVVTDKGIISVKPEDVEPGQTILVKPGEAAPLDGTLEENGDVDFNTSAITGESLPRTYTEGMLVNSGMIPVNKTARIKVTARYSDSSMSRIMKMIDDASKNRAPSETILRKITRWYTPLVFGAAVLIFVIPWLVSLFNPGFDFVWLSWFRRSLVFLVCACPCALVVSIPLTYFASIGVSSKKGVLFKGHSYLDDLRKIDTVYFDKTGTVTTGKFHVDEVKAKPGRSETDVIRIAATVEEGSAHPLAGAILEYAKEKGIAPIAASGVETVNHGMKAMVNGTPVLVGSRKFMEANDIPVDGIMADGTAVYVAAGGKLSGVILLSDTVKPGVRNAVSELHALGVKDVEILSGDTDKAVAKVAQEIGADGYKAQLLPADKRNLIEARMKAGHCVAFAGDGVNDAPALATADTGIAMGTLGTDMAIESAGVVIAGDDLSKIADGIKMSKRVRSVVIENVAFAFGVKILVMTLGAFGIATLWAAVFADTGVTLITIIWTLLRLKIWELRK